MHAFIINLQYISQHIDLNIWNSLKSRQELNNMINASTVTFTIVQNYLCNIQIIELQKLTCANPYLVCGQTW